VHEKEEREVFLAMTLRKGNYQTDAEGNFYFDVEASNENLDLEQQAVLQSALMNSREYFLTNGVISKDHLHRRVRDDGLPVIDEEYIIGEPVSVYADGASTRVKGKLYRKNRYARKFIDLLESGSTRVKVSVGGILPGVVKNVKEGTEKIVSVLWNDLALTVAPVNHTVSPAAGIAKSLSSLEFVKSLSAGYGTDAAPFTGGRALTAEGAEHPVVCGYEQAVAGLFGALMKGAVTDINGAKRFLEEYGFEDAEATRIIGEIAEAYTNFQEISDGKRHNV
jgi:hypothetical protein